MMLKHVFFYVAAMIITMIASPLAIAEDEVLRSDESFNVPTKFVCTCLCRRHEVDMCPVIPAGSDYCLDKSYEFEVEPNFICGSLDKRSCKGYWYKRSGEWIELEGYLMSCSSIARSRKGI